MKRLGEAVLDTRQEMAKLVDRLEQLSTEMYELKQKFNVLGDDMRQRFRLVADRLYAVEQKLAA